MSLRDDVYALLPGFVEAEEAAAVARRFTTPERSGSTGDAEYRDAVERGREAVLAGNPIPVDLARPVLYAASLTGEANLHRRLTSVIIDSFTSEADDALRLGANDALRLLDQRLDNTVRQVKDLAAALTDVDSEDDAARAGGKALEAWSTLTVLTDTYADIRSLQASITKRALAVDLNGPQVGILHCNGILRDSLRCTKHWVDKRTEMAARSNTDYTGNDHDPNLLFIRWIGDVNSRAAIDTTSGTVNPAEFLDLATRVKLWVPTTKQLKDAYAAAGTATKVVVGQVPSAQEEARADYYRVTGVKDTANLPAIPRQPARSTSWSHPGRLMVAGRTR